MKIKNPFKALNAIRPEDRIALILFAAVAVLIAVVSHPDTLVTAPLYHAGDVADANIKSPRDLLVQDPSATDQNRKRSVAGVLTVYDFDETLASKTVNRVNRAFSLVREAMAKQEEIKAEYEARLAKYEEEQKLYEEKSKALEEKKKAAAEAAAKAAAEAAAVAGKEAPPAAAPETEAKEPPPPPLVAPIPPAQPSFTTAKQAAWSMKGDFEKALGFEVNDGAYSLLEKEGFSEEIADLIGRILKTILDNGVVGNKESLLEEERGIALRGLPSGNEQVVYGLKRFYGLDQAKTMVRVAGDPLLRNRNYNLVNMVVDFAQRLINQPNVTMNKHETLARRTAAAESVKPVYFQVKAGEMLLREGDRVTEEQILKLAALRSEVSRQQVITESAGVGALVLIFLYSFHFVFFRRYRRSGSSPLKDTVLVAVILSTFILISRIFVVLATNLGHGSFAAPFPSSMIYAAPLPAATMVLCVFLGLSVALPFAMVQTFCVTTLFGHPFETWVYFLLNSILAAYWVRSCRERNVFIKAGLMIGLLNLLLVICLYLQKGTPFTETLLYDGAAAFLGGLFSGVLTAGIVPLVEIAGNYTTDIKLLELANLDRPVLKRLMIEAPGTYHHCMVVGSLVEAAAAEIGANPLLARVCGYYHDIGKIKKPLYFIENQMDGKNRHDKLAPSMSSLILIAHVRDGVELARQYRLGADIRDCIQQHHGTSLIKFFFDKARQQKGDENVSQEDFRYPGPKPQTKEAGLVMLADVVEAASRTLDNPTPSRIQGLVQKLISKIFSDGQLDECELTLKDLHQIAKSFNKILAGIHHHRIEYEPAAPKVNGKGKKPSAGPDPKPAEEAPDPDKKDPEQSSEPLKRLGIP